MRRIVWAFILIPILIGAVIAANTLLTQSGFIRVVAPGLVWVGSPPSFPDANFTRPLLGSVNQTIPFTIKNTGQLSLLLTETFSGNGTSLLHASNGFNGSCLAVGQSKADSITLTVSNTTQAAYYTLGVQIGYSGFGSC